MLMTVDELRKHINTDETDEVLKMRLEALELSIRRYTSNNFQRRDFRIQADIRAGIFMSESLIPFSVGDTIMVSESDLQSDCLAVVSEITDDTTFTTDSDWADDNDVLVTKVVYPADVKLGAAKILAWQEVEKVEILEQEQDQVLCGIQLLYVNIVNQNTLFGRMLKMYLVKNIDTILINT